MSIDLLQTLKTHNILPKNVLHIGAHLAQELSIYKQAGCTSGVFVEGNPEVWAILNEMLRSEPSFYAVNALLADVDGGLKPFFLASNSGMSSSFLKPDLHLTAHPEVHFEDSPILLETTKLDSLNLGVFDLIVMDVQGTELYVLKGGVDTFTQAKVLMLEVNLGGLYEGDCSVNELISYLTPFGFSPVTLSIGSKRYGDCIFIKTSTLESN